MTQSSSINKDKFVSLLPLKPSTFETIDFALYDFITSLNLHCTTNKGWKATPIIWAGAERAKQSDTDPERKDLQKSLIFPVITIERKTLDKNEASKGNFHTNIPPTADFKGGSIVIQRRIKQDVTAAIANADALRRIEDGTVGVGQINFPRKNKKIVYEILSIPMPVYCEMMYEVKIKTEYQQQMNELIVPFIVKPGSIKRVMIKKDGYKYEAFIQGNIAQENNIGKMGLEARKYESTISIKVFGMLIGADENNEGPFITIRESAAELKIQRERVIVGDIPGFTINGKFRP